MELSLTFTGVAISSVRLLARARVVAFRVGAIRVLVALVSPVEAFIDI